MQQKEKNLVKKHLENGITLKFFSQKMGVHYSTIQRFILKDDYLLNDDNFTNLKVILDKLNNVL